MENVHAVMDRIVAAAPGSAGLSDEVRDATATQECNLLLPCTLFVLTCHVFMPTATIASQRTPKQRQPVLRMPFLQVHVLQPHLMQLVTLFPDSTSHRPPPIPMRCQPLAPGSLLQRPPA